MKALIGVAIATKTDPENQYVVDQKHWEYLVAALNEGQLGRVELDTAIPGGKLNIDISNIAEIFLSTEEYVENFEDRKRRSELES